LIALVILLIADYLVRERERQRERERERDKERERERERERKEVDASLQMHILVHHSLFHKKV